MKNSLIVTSDYLLLVDEDAEIKEGYDCILSKDRNTIFQKGAFVSGLSDGGTKLIAYYPLTKEAKELEGLPLLPSPFKTEDNIEELADKRYPLTEAKHLELNIAIRTGFVAGYKAAQADKQFSLEDIRKCFIAGALIELFNTWGIPKEIYAKEKAEQYIQSLSTQQLPKEFISEDKSIEDIERELGIYGHDEGLAKTEYQEYIKKHSLLKTIINSENKIELVGEYKY
jgi:hypothetical protein